MKREEKILHSLNKNGYGVEIGPSHNPVAPKKAGYLVHVIDHMSRQELMEKYKDTKVKLENVEEVDYVWRGEPYDVLTGKSKFYDWIIASHVIEHTPDFIGFLNNCDSILKDDGVISLAIPDVRYTFDYFRPITGISRIIDAYFQKNTIHTPGTAAEYLLNVVYKNGNMAWSDGSSGEYTFIHSLDDTLNCIDHIINNKLYLDVHAWCFTPHSFRLIIHDLNSLGFIPFKEVSFFPTYGHEFYVTLGRAGEGIHFNRLELLKKIKSEISDMSGEIETPVVRASHIRRLTRRFAGRLKENR